jgi:hypothetical protein
MTESLASPKSVPGNRAQENSGCIEIAGYRRILIFVFIAPYAAVVLVGLNILAHDAMSGFPDRRPILIFYAAGFLGFLALFLVKFSRKLFRFLYLVFIARSPALFIEDGSLIYIRKQHFSAPVPDVDVSLGPTYKGFKRLLVVSRSGKRLSIGLVFLNKPGPEIIDAINAHRLPRSG